jgi:hypothetical protein
MVSLASVVTEHPSWCHEGYLKPKTARGTEAVHDPKPFLGRMDNKMHWQSVQHLQDMLYGRICSMSDIR